jgi:hypothetical protein
MQERRIDIRGASLAEVSAIQNLIALVLRFEHDQRFDLEFTFGQSLCLPRCSTSCEVMLSLR